MAGFGAVRCAIRLPFSGQRWLSMQPSGSLRSMNVQDPPKLLPTGQASPPLGRSTRFKDASHPWTAEEIRIVEQAQAKSLVIKAFAHLLPRRTYPAIGNMIARVRRGDANRKFPTVRWSIDEKALVRDLQARGLELRDICARFPNRSDTAVLSAVRRYGHSVAQITSTTSRSWISDDKSYLIKAASRGVGVHSRYRKR